MTIKPGLFITFEGGEGTGKSTLIQTFFHWIVDQGIESILTREPGGTPGAELIRKLLVQGQVDQWDHLTEAFLLFAARREHLQRLVWPAMRHGKVVLSDRFVDSTFAYQGYGYGVDLRLLQQLYEICVQDHGFHSKIFWPDLTIILDIDPEIGLARAGQRDQGDQQRYEKMDLDFHRKLREGYLKVAETYAQRCVVLDANQSPDKVFQQLQQVIKQRWPNFISTIRQ